MERELYQNKTIGRMTRRLGLFDMKNNELRVELGMERDGAEMKLGNIQRWNWQNLMADWMWRERERDQR